MPVGAPKKPASAFFLFSGDKRAEIVAKDPSLSVAEVCAQVVLMEGPLVALLHPTHGQGAGGEPVCGRDPLPPHPWSPRQAGCVAQRTQGFGNIFVFELCCFGVREGAEELGLRSFFSHPQDGHVSASWRISSQGSPVTCPFDAAFLAMYTRGRKKKNTTRPSKTENPQPESRRASTIGVPCCPSAHISTHGRNRCCVQVASKLGEMWKAMADSQKQVCRMDSLCRVHETRVFPRCLIHFLCHPSFANLILFAMCRHCRCFSCSVFFLLPFLQEYEQRYKKARADWEVEYKQWQV